MILIDLRKDETEHFKCITFPDGQVLIELKNYLVENLLPTQTLIIMSYGKWSDIQKILCLKRAISHIAVVDKIILYMPYLMGARSDRRFGYTCDYLQDITAQLLNDQFFDKVICIDAHNVKYSDAYIESLVNIMPITDIASCVVFPDKGASERYSMLSSYYIVFSKTRDADGNIIGMDMQDYKLCNDRKNCLVIDDLCDGGKTFIEVGKKLKQAGFEHLTLKVTHGIFSKGLEELYQYYDVICTTNSYQELTPTDRLTVQDVFDLNIIEDYL